ncbi:hypothetical protein BS78_08G104000 [Paspalum vaginatum]|nr:hypothetical protein BS78_08G104000 [Paspalum vaginatum]
MATTAALTRRLSASFAAAHRRLSSFTASTNVHREVSGSHKLTIGGYTQLKKTAKGWWWWSEPFEAAGYSWRIRYLPFDNDYISFHLEVYDHGASKDHVDAVKFKMSLLNQSGDPVFTCATEELCDFNGGDGRVDRRRRHGFPEFIKCKDLEESGCLENDRFSIRCDITALTVTGSSCEEAAPAAHVVVPPSDLHAQLTDLLWRKKQAADVTVDVGGEAAFDAHGWLLAARSPVLGAELDKEKSGRARRRIEIQGVEPKVFKAVLHYMYTDALPAETEGGDRDSTAAMAQDLLAAAHRFQLERLRLMCEEMLCKRIDVGTVADTLVVAERHGCRGLKAACVEFLSCPGNLKAAMATEGFEKLKSDCPALLAELVMIKQLDA